MLRQGKQSVADCGGWMSTNRSEASNRSWLVGGKTEGGGGLNLKLTDSAWAENLMDNKACMLEYHDLNQQKPV